MEFANKIRPAGNRPHGKGRLAARFPKNYGINAFLNRCYDDVIDDAAQDLFPLLKGYESVIP